MVINTLFPNSVNKITAYDDARENKQQRIVNVLWYIEEEKAVKL